MHHKHDLQDTCTCPQAASKPTRRMHTPLAPCLCRNCIKPAAEPLSLHPLRKDHLDSLSMTCQVGTGTATAIMLLVAHTQL
jgi:hypothetical protein